MWTPVIDTDRDLKHRAIVNALRTDIEAGRLRLGDRLPPARTLAAELGIAVGTVARAYRDAAHDGLIQSEVGRGTHVLGATTAPAVTNTFGARADGLIDLSIDYPLEHLDPDPGPVLEALARSPNRLQLMRYLVSEGSPTARAAGANWATRYGLPGRGAQDVILCSGNQHALTVSLASIFNGRPGKLFAEALAYPGLQEAAALFGIRPEPVAIDDEGMIPEALEEACAAPESGMPSAVYLVPSLHNPTAAAMTDKRREAIAMVAERHGLYIIEDDVHRLHAERPGVPITTLAPERSFFIAGLSKVVSAGLRIAYLFPPRDKVNDAARRVLATQWSVAPLMAEMATRWIEDGTADAVRIAKAQEAGSRQRLAAKLLGEYWGLRSQPHSFYLWLDLPEGWSGDGFALAAARSGVGVLSDTSFRIGGGATGRQGVRICLGAAESQDELRTALGAIEPLLRQSPGFSQRII